jgi:hypothetical protein
MQKEQMTTWMERLARHGGGLLVLLSLTRIGLPECHA